MTSDPNKTVKIVFACLDWRLHPQIEEYFTKDGTGCDMCVSAGSVKDLIEPATRNLFIKQINVSKKLHDCKGVILTMHLNCGAYCGAPKFDDPKTEIEASKDELKKAREIVKSHFPELPVQTYIIGLEKTESGWNILPQEISQ